MGVQSQGGILTGTACAVPPDLQQEYSWPGTSERLTRCPELNQKVKVEHDDRGCLTTTGPVNWFDSKSPEKRLKGPGTGQDAGCCPAALLADTKTAGALKSEL